MKSSKIITLSELSSYNYYVVDVLGTVHNGISIFPGVLTLFTWLKKNHKEVVLLTNSPLKSDCIIQLLKEMGLERNLYTSLLTSGDFFQHLLRKKWPDKKLFFLNDNSHFKEMCSSCSEVEEADYIVIEEILNDLGQIELFEHILERGLSKNIPLICINPDLIAIRAEGVFPRPGIIAQWYKNKGGKNILLGKPNPEIFAASMPYFSQQDLLKTLVIGDTLETDVLGAQLVGMDSLLITHTGRKKQNTLSEHPFGSNNYFPEISFTQSSNLYSFLSRVLELKHFLKVKKLPVPNYTTSSMLDLANMIPSTSLTQKEELYRVGKSLL